MPLFARSAIDTQQVENAIAQLEKKSSAELRVYIEKNARLKGLQDTENPILARAEHVFFELGMDKTEAHNGVLIYVALNQRQCAVLGDYGIDQFVEATFWQNCCHIISEQAKNKQLTQGLVDVINLISDKLSAHFPYQIDDINELPNEVIINE